MPQSQLSVRSTKAKELAHQIAKRERRTVSQVVELALESYANRVSQPNAFASPGAEGFWSRMSREFGGDVDLWEIITAHRHPQRDVDL